MGVASFTARGRLALLALLLAAAALRFGGIGDLPAGFQHDEAAYALDARNVLAGQHAIFFERSNGREPLFIYTLAGSFALFGIGVWPARIVSAAFGLLTVAAVARLACDLFGPRSALLAAGFLALGYWPVHVSHTAFRAVTLPLLLTLAAIAFLRVRACGGIGRAALAGALLGATMYTYLSSRLLPLLVLGWIALSWWIGRQEKGSQFSGREVLVLVLVASAVFAPLGWYYGHHPDAFVLRSAQVNDLRPILQEGDFRPLVRDTLTTLGMFLLRGDDSWKYNLAGRPVFDPLSGLLFLGGLLLLGWWAARPGRARFAALFLLSWLLVMLIPGCVSGESPHFLRTIGALPVVFLIPALALDRLLDRLPAPVTLPLVVLGFLAFGSLTAFDLFVRWATAPEQRAFFRADYATLARVLTPDEQPVIAAEYPYDLDPLDLELIRGGQPLAARWFDGRTSLLLPARGGSLFAPAFARPPGSETVPPLAEVRGPGGQPGLVRYAAATYPFLPETHAEAVGNHLLLVGWQAPTTIQAGETLTVPVGWQVRAGGAPADLAFSLKLVGPWESVWAQHDLSPVPPADWQAGDRLIVFHQLALDLATPPGIYQLALQVYRRGTVTPERFANGEDRFLLGEVRVERGAPARQATLHFRHTTPARFGEAIALLGYEIDKPVAAAGETLGLTLYWQALREDLPDWTVFTHLLYEGEPTRLYGQRDSQPVFGAYPTPHWQRGEVVKDRYDIPIDPQAPAGRYRIAVGLYDRTTGARVPTAPVPRSLADQALAFLARLGLPYERERVEADRVLLRPNWIERR